MLLPTLERLVDPKVVSPDDPKLRTRLVRMVMVKLLPTVMTTSIMMERWLML
jgi:hypothetical protein